ncbi:MAG TPA: endolytic transglycosylase MltG [Bacillota bacterium]|nr:endolytic transglycosylase MltG [Bacillota bacterium]
MKNIKQGLSLFFRNHPRLGTGFLIFTAIFIFLGVIFLINLFPVRPGGKETQVFKVSYGASLREVAYLLESRKLIRNKTAFEIYVRLDYRSRKVEAGWYKLGTEMSVPRIVRELHRGTPPEIRVTIPEGLNLKELTNLLAEKELVDPKRFLAKLNDLPFINKVLDGFAVSGSSEGYLFPDTYNFVLPVSEEKIIETMLRRFKEVFTRNFPDVPESKRKQIVILASIVEEEAKKNEERPIIAGVFYNRLQNGDRLWSCATVQYALGTHKKKLYYKDLKVNSPYNTYLHDGLPPGPIASPGLASLKATVFPAKVSYSYFVAKPDGTHVFSKTLPEHLKASASIQNLY